MIAAKARYGLTSPPGMRVSTRFELRARRYGTRTYGCRGPRECRRRPAAGSEPLVRVDRRGEEDGELLEGGDLAGEKAVEENVVVGERSLPVTEKRRWTWHELPIQDSNGFAMNVIEQPFANAISLAPLL